MFLANFHFGKTRNLKQIILPSGHTGFDLDRCFVHRLLCSQWHNYWCQQRQAGRANEQSTYLGVYGFVTQKCFFIFASSNAV